MMHFKAFKKGYFFPYIFSGTGKLLQKKAFQIFKKDIFYERPAKKR